MTDLLWFVPHLICIPWSCYNTFKLYHYKDQHFVQKRSFSLVFGFNVALILSMMTATFSTIASLYFKPSDRKITYILNTISVFIVFFYLNTTNWMIYYQYHWTHYTLQLKWQQIINPKVSSNVDNVSNWFIKNRYKYGNLLYIYKLFGGLYTFFIVTVCISISVLVDTPNAIIRVVGTMLIFLISLSCVIFSAVIVKKTPSFNDMYYIHWESKTITKWLLFSYIFHFILGALNAYFSTKNEENRKIFGAISQIEILLMWFIMHYISTAIIISKNSESLQREISDKRQKIKIHDILANSDKINLFMRYLSREFNMGNLLSFIELNQYKHYLLDKVDSNVASKTKLVILPEDIPLSLIIDNKWSENEIDDIKITAYYLFKKYVEENATLEVNISYLQRQEIVMIVADLDELLKNENVTITVLFQVFDECIAELINLLRASFNRFKCQPEFNEISEDEASTEIITS